MNTRHVGDSASEISNRVTRWGQNNFQQYPWRSTKNHWLALTAEIMLQRTRAATVAPIWIEWAQKYPTPRALLDAPTQSVREIFKGLGLTWRVDLLLKLAKRLDAAGEIPIKKAELMELPGIGDYISSAFLSLHAGILQPIVDSNVVRWISRLTGKESDGETRRLKWVRELTDQLTPAQHFREYNYGLLDLTITVCKRSPICEICPVSEFCASRNRFVNLKS